MIENTCSFCKGIPLARPDVYLKFDFKAIPKPRLTQGDKWKFGKINKDGITFTIKTCKGRIRSLAKYLQYKDRLKAIFETKTRRKLPLTGEWKILVDCNFKNKVHGDTDNIIKGLQDTFFTDDKQVKGYCDYEISGKDNFELRLWKL